MQKNDRVFFSACFRYNEFLKSGNDDAANGDLSACDKPADWQKIAATLVSHNAPVTSEESGQHMQNVSTHPMISMQEQVQQSTNAMQQSPAMSHISRVRRCSK